MTMNMGPAELGIILVILAIPLGIVLVVWGLVDVSTRPPEAWEAIGQNRTMWLVAMIVGVFVCLGWLVAGVYLLAVRPKLAEAMRSGEPGPMA